ncbi:CHASE2 domain-containing protein [Okeania sp. SIO2B3]|uniref:CHASE2 domain-containing protein n=1 Tax=Okeania sp. SIO2B3 TaxID=2607784 RepID=UPI0013C28FF6|nr:CHASE2 domain-containing protein [Okeania sp. SIO2B3]NET45930.1 CHASE2 domain-containing protein [Okeania sp. SIO2B3]
MGKVIVFRFYGDLTHNGFHVDSTVQEESDSDNSYSLKTLADIKGYLPADSLLAQQVEKWQKKYRSLGPENSGNNPDLSIQYRGIQPIETTVQSNWLQRISECEQSAQQLKERFKSWLESPEFRQIDQQIRLKITSDEEVRFLIRTDDPKVHQLPWEEWDLIKDNSSVEVVFGPTESKHNHSFSQSVLRGILKILAILGDSKGINIEKDKQELKKLEEDGVAKVEFLEETNCEEIYQKLNEQSWDVIFFAGHGETIDENSGRIYLNSQGEYLELTDLWYSLRKAVERGLKIAIFNSCDGLGLARSLNDDHIPMMIVMRELLPNKVAHQFLINFLTAFQSGEPFHLAKRQAREQLKKIEKEYYPCATWLPAIYQSIETPSFKWEPSPASTFLCSFKTSAIACVGATFLTLMLRQVGLLMPLELNSYDRLLQMRPLEAPDERLLMITIDDKDVGSQSPTERKGKSVSDGKLEELLQEVNQYKPKVIGLNIYQDRPVESEYLKQKINNDRKLILTCRSPGNKNSGYDFPPEFLNLLKEIPEKDRTNYIQAKVGFSDVIEDNDRTLRRHLLGENIKRDKKCQTELSFSLAIARRYLYNQTDPSTNILSKGELNRIFEPLSIEKGGGYSERNWDKGGKQIMLNYRSVGKLDNIAPTFTMTEVLEERKLTRDLVENRIILIGTVDRDFDQLYYRTPYTQGSFNDTPAIVIQAHMISQIITAFKGERPLIKVWPRTAEYFWIATWSMIGGLIIWVEGLRGYSFHHKLKILMLGGTILTLYASCYILLIFGYWVPLFSAIFSLILTVGGALSPSLIRFIKK